MHQLAIVTELGADTDPFTLRIHAALAEKRRALISSRTREAVAAAKAGGAAPMRGPFSTGTGDQCFGSKS